MHLYENITIFNPKLTDEEINATVEKTVELITGNGGEALKVDHWGRRKLAYELNKHDKGYYVLILFKAGGDVMPRIEQAYKVNEQVIKHMTIKLGKKQAEGTLKALEAAQSAEAAPAPAAAAAAAAPAAEAAAETTEA